LIGRTDGRVCLRTKEHERAGRVAVWEGDSGGRPERHRAALPTQDAVGAWNHSINSGLPAEA
jgi:hypothetical protein